MSKDNSTAAVKATEQADGVSIKATARPSLLEEAKAVKEYKPDFESSKKFMKLLTEISDKAAALGSKITMSRAKVMRLESDTQNVTARLNPEQAAENILLVGKMWEEISKMAEEQQEYKTEYHRLKALADAVNVRTAEPDVRPIRLDGSMDTRRALNV